jgi:hypothetical protein
MAGGPLSADPTGDEEFEESLLGSGREAAPPAALLLPRGLAYVPALDIVEVSALPEGHFGGFSLVSQFRHFLSKYIPTRYICQV